MACSIPQGGHKGVESTVLRPTYNGTEHNTYLLMQFKWFGVATVTVHYDVIANVQCAEIRSSMRKCWWMASIILFVAYTWPLYHPEWNQDWCNKLQDVISPYRYVWPVLFFSGVVERTRKLLNTHIHRQFRISHNGTDGTNTVYRLRIPSVC